MMPGVSFIGGKLSVIGGYSWPGSVPLIEQWDEDNSVDGEWVKTNLQLEFPRYVLLTYIKSQGLSCDFIKFDLYQIYHLKHWCIEVLLHYQVYRLSFLSGAKD